MFSKVINLIFGLLLIWIGIRILKEGWSYLYRLPVPNWVGFFVIIFALALIYNAVFGKNKSS